MRVNRIASKLASALTALLFTFPAMGAELPVVELGAGMYRIEAELAATPQSRQIGLMNRNTMAPQHGMVFVFTADLHPHRRVELVGVLAVVALQVVVGELDARRDLARNDLLVRQVALHADPKLVEAHAALGERRRELLVGLDAVALARVGER